MVDLGKFTAELDLDTQDLERALAMLEDIERVSRRIKWQAIYCMSLTFGLGIILGFIVGRAIHG